MIQIGYCCPIVYLGGRAVEASEAVNDAVPHGSRTAVVRCSDLPCGFAFVVYSGAPEGDGVTTGAALRHELEAAVRAAVARS